MATQKQIKALDNLVGNGGNITQAMRDAGYSENTINTPQKLTQSQAFQQLMSEHGITDGTLIDVMQGGLQAKKVDMMGNNNPDHTTRHKYLETALRIKGLNKDGDQPSLHFHQHIEDKKVDYEF